MNSSSRFFRAPGLDELRERLDPGTVILAPYILAFVWQYFQLVGNRWLAWTLAAVFSAVIWGLYLIFKENVAGKLPRQFWWMVALPLLLIYSLRVAIPDISFDVLNYHIFHAERALRGPLLIPGDYFPTPAPFNPTPDILTGLYRYLLGYRLGTIANYFALIWTGTILNRLLGDYIASAWLRCTSILFILLTEQILFQVNNYMIDLLALPLLLEATRLAINRVNPGEETRRIVVVAALLGASAAFKLTNLMFGAPIVLVLAFNLLARSEQGSIRELRRLWKIVPVSALAFVVPLFPFTINLYRLTGSPVFPLYNAIFKSPYWPQTNVFDPRWGPHSLSETLLWPVMILFKQERFCEFPVYSGRLSMGFIIAVVCLALARKDRKIRGLCFITLAGIVLWSASSGYSRYAIYLELTSGLILIWLCWYMWKRSAVLSLPGRLLAQAPLGLLILAQTGLALNYASQYEWSMRATIFNPRARLVVQESKNFFRDRSLSAYLSPDDRALIYRVDVWVETTYKTTALEALLKPEIPVIGVRMSQFFESNTARQKFAQALLATQGKRMFTLTDAPNLQTARQALAARGLSVGKVNSVAIPYFSQSLKLDMLLVEVLPPESNHAGQPVAKGLPLPDGAFKASLALAKPLPVFQSGQKYEIRVILMNGSQVTWPGRQPEWRYQITIGNRWLNTNGSKVNDLDGRAALVDDLGPGKSVELPLTITAPQQAGDYILQIDSVQEGVAWFGDRGSEVLTLRVKVE